MAESDGTGVIPAGLLRGISRESLATGRAADLTLEYLEAGVGLVQKALTHDWATGVHPLLSWLSQRDVIAAVSTRGHLAGAAGTLRDRWEPHARYVNDLMTWIRYQRARPDDGAIGFQPSDSPSVRVRALSDRIQRGLFDGGFFRLQLLALVVLGGGNNADAARADQRLYDHFDRRWSPLIHDFLAARSIKLRPGIDERDVLEILTAVGEGLALRELEDATSGRQRDRRLSLQGSVALALIVACVDPGDGRSLDRLVDDLLSDWDGAS